MRFNNVNYWLLTQKNSNLKMHVAVVDFPKLKRSAADFKKYADL